MRTLNGGEVVVEAPPTPAYRSREELVSDLARLAERAEQAAQREQLARNALDEAHEQLAERDDEIALLVGPAGPLGEDRVRRLVEQRRQLGAELAATRSLLSQAEARLAAATSTRAWRFACAWWALRDTIRGR